MNEEPSKWIEPNGVVAIVDDDSQISSALGAWLDFHGLRAAHHISAESLLQSVQSTGDRLMIPIGVSNPVTFPLVGAVLDLNLPDRNGVELACQLRQLAPDLPMVIITALCDDERARYGSPPDDVRCLRKPFDLDALEDALFPRIP